MKSITRYLLLNASVWAIIVAFASGLVLSGFFRSSAVQAFDERLDIVLKILVGDIAAQQISAEPLRAPQVEGEPRFDLPLSGWYWTVSDKATEKVLIASGSLVGGDFEISPSTREALKETSGFSAEGFGPQGERVRILQREISFSEGKSLLISVTGNLEALEARVQVFQTRAWIIMALFGAFLLAVSTFLVKLALRPLNQLSEQVRKVAEGETAAIEGSYPVEVSGLVNEANMLILANKETLERARTQVGNLAHALKTPLSVMTNEARKLDGASGELIKEQSEIMKDQIQLYLERARIAARRSVIGAVTEVEPIMTRLVSVMQKIHSDKKISSRVEKRQTLKFRGEEQDLEEVVGNLLDNACKWATAEVSITIAPASQKQISQLDQSAQSNWGWFCVTIVDDGPGMTDEQIASALKRGNRLDESKSGSGLGLSIVEEIVSLYQGKFVMESSDLGGMRAILFLPAYVK